MKTLQKLEATQRDAQNTQAFQAFQQTHSKTHTLEAAPTERYGIYIIIIVCVCVCVEWYYYYFCRYNIMDN